MNLQNNEHQDTKFHRAPQFGVIPVHTQVATNALTSGRCPHGKSGEYMTEWCSTHDQKIKREIRKKGTCSCNLVCDVYSIT